MPENETNNKNIKNEEPDDTAKTEFRLQLGLAIMLVVIVTMIFLSVLVERLS